jgi:hypothetical protein
LVNVLAVAGTFAPFGLLALIVLPIPGSIAAVVGRYSGTGKVAERLPAIVVVLGAILMTSG